jgi:adenylosuccinate lyase
MQRNSARFRSAAEDMRVGKFSGAVGTFAHLTPELEEEICSRLGLKAAAISSQVIQRDRHAHYLATLAVIACTLDKIATEIRHLQRTEVREAEEYFSEKQKGSSAMPHKRNPVTCEQISGLARVVRSNAQAAFENVALWHERDISHSSVERVIIPDSTTLVDYLLQKTANLVETMFVYPQRMKTNLESTGGLVFSGQLLLDLVEHGVSREDAYRAVQTHAMRAWREGLNFRELVLKDKNIMRRVPRAQIERAFDLKRQLRNIDKIFDRVFATKAKTPKKSKRTSRK